MTYHVDFQPIGRRGPSPAEHSLLEAARQLGINLINLCAGVGTCGRCKVQLLEGQLSPPTQTEQEHLTAPELDAGYRLACQAYPRSDVRLRVPTESLSSAQRTQVEGQEVPVTPDPMVRSYGIHLTPASLENLTADDEQVRRALEAQHGQACTMMDIEVQRALSPNLRAWEWNAQVVMRNGECIAMQRAATPSLGLAVDLGTTKIAGYLMDLAGGTVLASQGLMNPQIAYGEDVVSRISRAMKSPDEAQQMQALVVEALNQLAGDLTRAVDATPADIVDAVVVGNTAMHHLLLRLPVRQLVLAPYVPAVSHAVDVKARDLGLALAAGAHVHMLPNVAGYVGADHVAMILGTQLWQAEETVLALDIGTNTEICLAHQGHLTSVSCASGPAFEGAHIKHGMRAAPGAIEGLRIVGDHVEYQTIGDAPPVGLCGSGILDALAQLYRHDIVDRSGRMGEHPRVRKRDNIAEFVLFEHDAGEERPTLVVTQKDVRELQLAKGAIRTGIQAMLEANALTDTDIERIVIAGAFGSYIDVSSAIAIGMLPSLPLERFQQVGNAAGTGARLALISRAQREAAIDFAGRVRYIELASVPNFHALFSQSLFLGEYRIDQT